MVRWKAEDSAVTGLCRGSRDFTTVLHGAASKKTPGISGISNSEPRAELRVGQVHVDVVGASLALAFLRRHPSVSVGSWAQNWRGASGVLNVPE